MAARQRIPDEGHGTGAASSVVPLLGLWTLGRRARSSPVVARLPRFASGLQGETTAEEAAHAGRG